MNSHSVIARVLCCGLSLLLAAQPSAVSYAAAMNNPEPVSVQEAIDELAARAQELEPRIDRSQFDLEALLDRLDYDPERIIEFVDDQIAMEIYPGALRGAAGTLASRAGNALDQSLLLATLLKDAGDEAVIRRATLPEPIALELVKQMALSRPSAPSVWGTEGDTPASSAAIDPEKTARRNSWLDSAGNGAAKIITALKRQDIQLSAADQMLQTVAEARDYYWVERRAGPSDGWQALHPGLGRDPGVEFESTMAEHIPTELAHIIKFELLLTRRIGSRSEEVPLMSPISRTSIEMLGKPLAISLIPDQFLNPEGPLPLEEIAGQTRFLFPMLNSGFAPGAQALSLRGLTVPPDAMQMGAAGVFETVSGKYIDAIDAISGMDSSEQPELTSVAIERIRLRITFTGPGGDALVQEREWFDARRDLPGEALSRPPGREVVEAIARTQYMVSSSGAISRGAVLEGLFDQSKSMSQLMSQAPALAAENCTSLACLNELDLESRGFDALLPLLFIGFDDQFATSTNVLAYRHRPNLVGFNLMLFGGAGSSSPEIDIISNARRVFAISGSNVAPDPSRLVRAGVWETHVETAFARLVQDPDMKMEIMPEELHAVSAEHVSAASESSSIARGILRDIGAGYVVLAPQSLDLAGVAATERWWRIDPNSGETLGMTAHGGAPVLELVTLILLVALSWLATEIILAIHCRDNPSQQNIALAELPPEDRFRLCLGCHSMFMTAAFYVTSAVVVPIGMAQGDDRGFDEFLDTLYRRCYR